MNKIPHTIFWLSMSILTLVLGLDASKVQAGLPRDSFRMTIPEIALADNITVTNPFGTHYLKQIFFDDKLSVVERKVYTTNGDGFRMLEILSSDSIQLISEQENINLIFRYISPGYYFVKNNIDGETGYFRSSGAGEYGQPDYPSWHTDIMDFVDYENQRADFKHVLLKTTTDGPFVCGFDRPDCEWLDATGPIVSGASVVIACGATYATLGALFAACGTTTFGFLERMRTFREKCTGCEPVTIIDDNTGRSGSGSASGVSHGSSGLSNYNSSIDYDNPYAWTCHAPYYVDTNPYDDLDDTVTICSTYGF